MARELGARRATMFLQEDGRLVARACRHADGTRRHRRVGRASGRCTTAARGEGRPGLRRARDRERRRFPVDRRMAGKQLRGPVRCSRSPLGDAPIGVIVLDDRGRTASPATSSAPRRAAAAEHVAADDRAGAARATSAAGTCAPRPRSGSLLEEGASAVSVLEEAGEVLARVTRDALGAETRDAAAAGRNEDDRARDLGRRRRRVRADPAGASRRTSPRATSGYGGSPTKPAEADLRRERRARAA